MKNVDVAVQIKPPKIEKAMFQIKGTAPYVQLRFSEKALNAIKAKHEAGSTANKKKAKEARDFEQDYEMSKHVSDDDWLGIPAGAIRQGMISACRLVGFKMTLAKLSVFVHADGYDKVDGVPLIRIYGEPEMCIHHARNANGGTDLRVRSMFKEWGAKLLISYDADQFTLQDVTNLIMRVGMQVGIGEGRPDSRMSSGMGWGTFEVV